MEGIAEIGSSVGRLIGVNRTSKSDVTKGTYFGLAVQRRLCMKQPCALCLALVVILTSTFGFSNWSFAQEEASAELVTITHVRAYGNGDIHIFFQPDVSIECGDRLRTSVGRPGQESVRALALAAIMSGRLVTVVFQAQRSGNWCELTYVQIAD